MRGRRCKLTRADPPESEPLLEKTPIAIRATLFDKYSNQLDHGGVRVDAKASGVGVSGAKVEDNKDGTYTISLIAGPPGEIKVTVRIDGNDLPPYVLMVQKSPELIEQQAAGAKEGAEAKPDAEAPAAAEAPPAEPASSADEPKPKPKLDRVKTGMPPRSSQRPEADDTASPTSARPPLAAEPPATASPSEDLSQLKVKDRATHSVNTDPSAFRAQSAAPTSLHRPRCIVRGCRR